MFRFPGKIGVFFHNVSAPKWQTTARAELTETPDYYLFLEFLVPCAGVDVSAAEHRFFA